MRWPMSRNFWNADCCQTTDLLWFVASVVVASVDVGVFLSSSLLKVFVAVDRCSKMKHSSRLFLGTMCNSCDRVNVTAGGTGLLVPSPVCASTQIWTCASFTRDVTSMRRSSKSPAYKCITLRGFKCEQIILNFSPPNIRQLRSFSTQRRKSRSQHMT